MQIERRNGVAVATLLEGRRTAGPLHVTWKGRIGKRQAPRGRYKVVVEATSSVGTSALEAVFAFRPRHRH